MADNRLSTFLPNRGVMGAKMLQRPAEPYLRQQAPEVYGALSGLMGTAPDQQGSVLDPNTARSRAGAEIGFPLGTALQMMPFAKPAVVGVKALGPTAGRMAEGYLTRTGGILPLDVYHGSPYKFDRFDASKIGSGEGAQAYGHGLYLAENPSVAQGYADRLGGGVFGSTSASKGSIADRLSGMFYGDGSNFSRNSRDIGTIAKNMAVKSKVDSDGLTHHMFKDGSEWIGSDAGWDVAATQKNLYKVDLPDEQIAKMLDWDKSLSQQPNIMEALTPENMGLTLRQPTDGGFMAYVGSNGKPIGLQVKGATPEAFRQKWIDRLTEFGNAEGGAGRAVGYLGGTSTSGELAPAVSSALRQAGIPGIKYLDEGSRKPGVASMSQAQLDTRINILKKDINSGLGDQNRMKQILSSLEAERASHPKLTRNFVTFPGEEKSLTILERNGQPSQNSLNSFMR